MEKTESRKIQVRIFEHNDPSIEDAMNDWLQENDVYVHDIQFGYSKFATSPGSVNPEIEWGIFSAIIYEIK